MTEFCLVRVCWTRQDLKELKEDTATGPDSIPSRILKRCATTLALPLTKLVRLLLRLGRWPAAWRLHWTFPIYKKKAVSDPGNYRGIHLTTVLSKVVERILQKVLAPFFLRSRAFGPSQFVFQRGVGCTDLLVVLICTWLHALQHVCSVSRPRQPRPSGRARRCAATRVASVTRTPHCAQRRAYAWRRRAAASRPVVPSRWVKRMHMLVCDLVCVCAP